MWGGFTKHYFVQLGFLDGFVGFSIAYLRSYGIFMRYVKLWLYRRDLE
ncbi:glycosyl transferase [Nonlabens ulvanivorans]|uniref:Glycosyl transferase n=1 Tax=Nonlabens ulvanivorans TaxID=906888 RepID=A0A090QFA8_NONUL|nr:glycosyl transferase [Nonlabens ulvanivorans]